MGDDEAVARLCEAIGVMVFSLATIMKVPQIVAIVRAGTTKGINISSLAMECWCFSILLAYPIANGYAFTSYMEFVALNVQDIILVLIVLKDKNRLNLMTTALLALYLSFIAGLALNWLPPAALSILSLSVTPFAIGGKSLQVYSIVKSKDAGTVSPLTWGIASFTATARVFTSLVQSKDMFLLFISAQAAVLNCAICVSAWVYKPRPKLD